ncbi:glyoxylase-like metal-dependent hydrolase (beta-lactamase superfamily II) [Paenibacillus rhizosphaerae]|uniref:Glyoxylase-like metal-dependent hydrolase (Beta-lactamase superfamily II) n=1 Tax=Paenibacillus rhizosphaerae TaxID=297318 RepID=A0A839TL06_9BACL|nr:MBL fold metallo-hydrolase [Paenibacillus rhizosphaerae]MBB3126059.1 glyoxylase-like metal-dependent hydrolase (beta-lactamase superfamily II) [Paenibacillus rhizosphaerae]
MSTNQTAASVYMLDVSAVMMGSVNTVHPAVITDGNHTLLIDTGYPGQYSLLREAMKSHGLSIDSLTHVIITHQDLDHIGSLPAIRQHAPRPVEVMSSQKEKPYIQGEKRLIKVTPEAIERAKAALPPEVPAEWRKAFISTLENPPRSPVDTIIHEDEELPICGGIAVIGTPGHTPGHISLYHRPTRTLVAADALRVVGGELLGPDPDATVDIPLAMRSIAQLAAYDIASVICYHGGSYDGPVVQRLMELSRSQRSF